MSGATWGPRSRGSATRSDTPRPGGTTRCCAAPPTPSDQLVGAGLLDHATARAELVSAGGFLIDADCGCTATEITRVIDAGLTAGARNPRRTHPRTSTGRDAA